MPNILQILQILLVIFLSLSVFYNFINIGLPKIPGDINLDKGNFKLYIPFTSALIISAIFTVLLNIL